MTQSEPRIDFTELAVSVPGEDLEALTRQIGYRKGLSPTWSGRGADSGRDLIFTEILSRSLSKEKVTWLVSCKDKAKSGDSVSERDLPQPGIRDKLVQHKANGFLLVTTTTVSTGAKSLLDSLDKSNGGDVHILVWDSSELTAILLDPENQDLLKQFLPHSYQRVRGLTSVEGAVLAFRDQLPQEVVDEIMRLVRPYSEAALKGSTIWPYDAKSSNAINHIVLSLLINEDVNTAVSATGEIAVDAFVTFANKLHEEYEDECYEYLLAIVRTHSNADIRFNAAQILFDKYELDPSEVIDVVTHLDSDALEILYDAEVASFVTDELYTNTPDYDLYHSLDELSSATQIDEIHVENVKFEVEADEKRVNFSSELSVGVTFMFAGEEAGESSFPGTFTGYFDQHGMYLEEASVDTSSYFGSDPD